MRGSSRKRKRSATEDVRGQPTNLVFRDWPTLFPNATRATALIDRVVHHDDV